MNRLRGWWRIALGVLALLAIPALVEAHTLTGSGGWLDELVCLVPALLMVAAVLVLGRDTPGKGKTSEGAAEADDAPGEKSGDLI
ncbi:MAG TPA: hypothetical protein VFZ25_00310 [Chloroflexota bacterium]|nr:hypothetical protein [Chloroflexota bacterium]